MKLTPANYFTPENNYLTNSKAKDFLKSREYFKAKHIDCTLETKTSDAMIEGSMLDDYLCKGERYFNRMYQVVKRRSHKNPPDGYVEVTEAMYDATMDRVQKVKRCSAYKKLHTFKKQLLLSHDIKNFGNFHGIAGMLDFAKINKKSATIVDLKTAQSIVPRKYIYQSRELGYDKQLAWYGWLIHEVYGIPYQHIEYKHLTIEKDRDGIHNVGTFLFDRDMIDETRREMQVLAKTIAHCEDWTDDDVSWENAILITDEKKVWKSETTKLDKLPNA